MSAATSEGPLFGDDNLGKLSIWTMRCVFEGTEYDDLDTDGIAEAANRAIAAGRLDIGPELVEVDIQAAIYNVARAKNFNLKRFPYS